MYHFCMKIFEDGYILYNTCMYVYCVVQKCVLCKILNEKNENQWTFEKWNMLVRETLIWLKSIIISVKSVFWSLLKI